jgi:hypothetical protein
MIIKKGNIKMDLKSFVTLESSEFLRNRQAEQIIDIKERIEQLREHIKINPEKQLYKYGKNINRLKGFEEELIELQNNPYKGFLCSREDAYNAFVKYNDTSLTKYYIMSHLYCSYGDMKTHLPTLLNEFEKETEFMDKMLIDFKDISFNVKKIKNFNLKYLEFSLGWYKDEENLNIEEVIKLTITNMENLVEIRNNLIKIKNIAC